MKRLFPAPWLSLALWLLWLVLNLSLSPGNLLLGAVLGFCAPLLMAPAAPAAGPHPPARRDPAPVPAGRPRCAGVQPRTWPGACSTPVAARRARRFIKVPLDLRDANGLAALAMITTVVPGTVWSELALDRSILLLHVFDLDDEAPFIEHFKATYERPLMEIFE